GAERRRLLRAAARRGSAAGARPRPGEELLMGSVDRRVLVIANETLPGHALQEVIGLRAAGGAEVLVVAPALNGRLAHWSSDEDRARRVAAARLERCLADLRARGIQATGRVGDADPLLAIDDALRTFGADEIVVATHPE